VIGKPGEGHAHVLMFVSHRLPAQHNYFRPVLAPAQAPRSSMSVPGLPLNGCRDLLCARRGPAGRKCPRECGAN
jgi:hypothetical protein